jgi:histidinol-phosphate aminotransferase
MTRACERRRVRPLKETPKRMDDILLDRNENHYGPSPRCLSVIRQASTELIACYTRDFKHGYYSELSQHLCQRHGIEEKRIVLGYGCEDLLKQAVHHYLRAGQPCLVPSASWWYYNAIADEVGGVTVEYPIVERLDSYEYDIDALKRIHSERGCKLLLISTPNNPTGNIFPYARIGEVLEHFRDAIVILDEAYLGFADEPQPDLAPFVERYPNLLVLRSFSKLYGLAGARIGYGIAGAGLQSFLRFSARYLGYNRLSERVALAALGDVGYYEDLRRRFARDRRRFYETLGGFEGVRVYRSQANFVLARFPESVLSPLKAGLEQRGLVIKFFSEPAFKTCARITLGTEPQNTRLLDAFRELLPRWLGSEQLDAPAAQ